MKRKWAILAADILLIPSSILCKHLSAYMLTQSSECAWVRLGGKCITCGGTHFVNAFCSGRFAEAFQHNEFLFLMAILVLATLVVLNLAWIFEVKFAKKVLRWIFSIPTLVVLVLLMLAFFVIRNIPVFVHIAQILS